MPPNEKESEHDSKKGEDEKYQADAAAAPPFRGRSFEFFRRCSPPFGFKAIDRIFRVRQGRAGVVAIHFNGCNLFAIKDGGLHLRQRARGDRAFHRLDASNGDGVCQCAIAVPAIQPVVHAA